MLADSSKIYEEGMTISATLVKREDLHLGQHERVFRPQPKPTASRRRPARATPRHTAPVSAGGPPTKRKGWSDSDMAAKRFKADEVCRTTPHFIDEQIYLLVTGMSEMLALSLKRNCSTLCEIELNRVRRR